ncbi:MAG: putative secreted protein [Labilithrix sp.]|nr:putative secreted protein [Labilithrix sp.]
MRHQSLLVLGFTTAIIAACGGSVSLGDLGSSSGSSTVGDGGGAANDGGAATECTSKADCGPAPKSPAIVCSDGSLGGNTGRCLKTATGCGWERRECPPDVCFDTGGTLDPNLTKCTAPADCVAVAYQSDCCGNHHAAGVNVANEAKVTKCASEREASYPKCTCPEGPPVADDGSTGTFGGGPPAVTCNASGHCETSYKGVTCGTTTCNAGQTCCSGQPFPSPTCVDGSACPISQRKHKKQITYLSEPDRERLSDELLRFPLATYRYKSESENDREHLGFIIDDVAPSPAVQQSGERVDMYGYQTMTVAAVQVQARELAALKREVEELKRTCGGNAKKR